MSAVSHGWPMAGTFSALVAATIASSAAIHAQEITCRAVRATAGSYQGVCARGDSTIARVDLEHPSPSTPYLWRGRSTTPDGSTAAVDIDTRPGGAVQVGRDWLALAGVDANSGGIRFSFRFGEPAPPSPVDAEILRRARDYLSAPGHWDPSDYTDMEAAPNQGFDCPLTEALSLFCALYFSSVQVTGYYAHFRPAMSAVRHAVDSASTEALRHPLVDFNNAASTTVNEILSVLDAALKRIRDQLVSRELVPVAEPTDPLDPGGVVSS